MALADLTTAELLERLAARTPAPAAGTAAALAGALAAALVEMVSAFALERSEGDGDGEGEGDDEANARLHRRAAALRTRLLELADEDTASYEPVLRALALEAGDAGRASKLDDALSGATDTPLEIAQAAAEVGERAAEVAQADVGRHLVGDARAAVVIAEAAVAAAASLVELNLAASPHDERVGAAAALAERARRLRAEL